MTAYGLRPWPREYNKASGRSSEMQSAREGVLSLKAMGTPY